MLDKVTICAGTHNEESSLFLAKLMFDEQIKKYILSGDHNSIVHYEKLGKTATLAVPTNEHFLPLLYTLALQDKNDSLSFFSEKSKNHQK